MRIRLIVIAIAAFAAVVGAFLFTSAGAGGQQAGSHCSPAGTSGPAFTDTLVPYPIPDFGELTPGEPSIVQGCFTIDNPGIINQVNVGLGITHTWVGDLIVTLTHEDTGRSITLIDRPGVPPGNLGCSGDDITIVLTDSASSPVEDKCNAGPPAISGTYRPQEPLAAFIGEAIAGTWTLTVTDNNPIDTGTLDSWTLIPTLKDPACDPAGTSGPAFSDTLVPYSIPDAGQGKARACFTIDDPGMINQVDVGLGITHTWVGDLIVTLTHDDTGTSVVLIDRPGLDNGGQGCSGNDISVVLTDKAGFPVEDACDPQPPAIAGTWAPNEQLSAFIGEGIAGTWTLVVSDNAALDTGALDSWTLIPTLKDPTATPTSTATVTSTPTTTPSPSPTPEKPCGDVNSDGEVTSLDALLILQFVAGFLDSVPNPDSADVNSDGQTDSVDALGILQLTAGFVDTLNCA